MKAPDFWYKPACVKSLLLSPFGQIYRMAGIARRVVSKPYLASIPVICVGNLVAGGAGKTPTALALAKLLKQQGANPAFVTRGYGGTAKKVLRVDLKIHTAQEVGDEALLLAKAAPCWIGRDRAAAVREAEKFSSHIIMDDGLQNPSVTHTTSLLVIDGAVGLGNSQIIPAGPLRETLADALQRVNAVVIIGDDVNSVSEKIRTESPSHASLQVFPAQIQTRLPADFQLNRNYFAFAGIGRPDKFYVSCRKAGLKLVGTKDFSDHHKFTADELSQLIKQAEMLDAQLITTEKDWVRLPENLRGQISVLPIELVFENAKMLELLSEKSFRKIQSSIA